MPGVSGISRQALLKALGKAAAPVSSHQLLRWTHAGWVHPPSVKGLGRGRGVVATYPGESFWECYFLARFTREMRATLREAGWFIWVLGLGKTQRIRALLLADLKRRLAAATLVTRPGRQARTVERELARLGRSRSLAFLQMAPERVARLARATAAFEAGSLGEEANLDADAWDDFQDGAVKQGWKPLRGALPSLALPSELDAKALLELRQIPGVLAAELSLQPVIHALETWSDAWLQGTRNEIQLLFEELAGQRGLIPSEAFIQHIRNHLDPEQNAALRAYREKRGWVSPPPPPFFRWPEYAAFRRVDPSTPGATDGTVP